MDTIYDDGVIPGNEAIAFQANSPLAKGMTAIFQEALDHRDKLRTKYLDKELSAADYDKQMYKFAKGTMSPKLRAHILKETGLDLKYISIQNTKPHFGLYAVDLSMDSLHSTVMNIEKMLGRKGYTPEDDIKKRLRESMEMSENLDLLTGKLSSSIYGNKRRITGCVYLDMLSAFLPDLLLDFKEDEFLVAEELAAIIMHEVGHVLTLVEHAGYWHATRLSIGQVNKLASVSNPAEVFQSLSGVFNESIGFLKKKGFISEKNAKILENCIASVSDAYNEMVEDSDGSFVKSVAIQALITLVWALTTATGYMLALSIEWRLIMEMMESIFSMNSDNGGAHRSTDTKYTSHDSSRMERVADEFVSRHGMGQHLASGLSKIMYMGRMFMASGMVGIGDSRARKMFHWLVETRCFINELQFAGLGSIMYEGRMERFDRMRQNAQGAFRQFNMPPDMVERYMNDLKGIEKICEEQRKRYAIVFAEHLWKFLGMFGLPNVWRMLNSGNLDRDYKKMFDKLDELTNSKLYVQAYRIEQMT